MKGSEIHFAVAGFGHIGKRHAEMIRLNPQARLVAVCDVVPANEVNGLPEGVLYYTNYNQMLAECKSVEVVNICVPNGLHAQYALEAFDAGKHVVCEKPMALTKADAERMVFKSLEVSRHFFCVMQNRFSAPSQWLKHLVSNQKLGDIYLVQINCFWNRDARYYTGKTWHGTAQLDGGTLFTQFSHFIDTIYWLFGDITNVKANTASFSHKELTEFEDTGVVSFNFMNGGMGVLSYSTSVVRKNFESSITIIGSKGTVKVAGQYMTDVVYCDLEDGEMPDVAQFGATDAFDFVPAGSANHYKVIQNVIDKVNEKGVISTNALEGMKVVDMIERIYQSI